MELNDYNACVKEWSDAVFRFAYKCTGNREDAQDVVQAGFEVLWSKRKEIIPGKAKAFLFQVVYRQSIDLYRKNARMDFKETIEHTGSHKPSNPDLKKLLDKALELLDEQSKALVLLKDYEGYSYEEIGQITEL